MNMEIARRREEREEAAHRDDYGDNGSQDATLEHIENAEEDRDDVSGNDLHDAQEQAVTYGTTKKRRVVRKNIKHPPKEQDVEGNNELH
jgi:hypothetical protein